MVAIQFRDVQIFLLIGNYLVGINHPFTVKGGKLGKYDQIVVYLAMKIFHESPGMTGLCISAAYSATLSTLSTGLNSFATVAFKVIHHTICSISINFLFSQ